jgi:hypothetical protein
VCIVVPGVAPRGAVPALGGRPVVVLMAVANNRGGRQAGGALGAAHGAALAGRAGHGTG